MLWFLIANIVFLIFGVAFTLYSILRKENSVEKPEESKETYIPISVRNDVNSIMENNSAKDRKIKPKVVFLKSRYKANKRLIKPALRVELKCVNSEKFYEVELQTNNAEDPVDINEKL